MKYSIATWARFVVVTVKTGEETGVSVPRGGIDLAKLPSRGISPKKTTLGKRIGAFVLREQ